jgi:hypothetical protein
MSASGAAESGDWSASDADDRWLVPKTRRRHAGHMAGQFTTMARRTNSKSQSSPNGAQVNLFAAAADLFCSVLAVDKISAPAGLRSVASAIDLSCTPGTPACAKRW